MRLVAKQIPDGPEKNPSQQSQVGGSILNFQMFKLYMKLESFLNFINILQLLRHLHNSQDLYPIPIHWLDHGYAQRRFKNQPGVLFWFNCPSFQRLIGLPSTSLHSLHRRAWSEPTTSPKPSTWRWSQNTGCHRFQQKRHKTNVQTNGLWCHSLQKDKQKIGNRIFYLGFGSMKGYFHPKSWLHTIQAQGKENHPHLE